MILRNKNKYLVYKTLLKFKKYGCMFKTQDYITKKFKFDEYYFAYIVGQCVEMKLLDGIRTSKSINNHYHNVYSENIYITYNGYEFLKNYHSKFYSLLRDLFLIFITAVVTATITVLINNKFSKSNQSNNIFNDICSKETICSDICNNSD